MGKHRAARSRSRLRSAARAAAAIAAGSSGLLLPASAHAAPAAPHTPVVPDGHAAQVQPRARLLPAVPAAARELPSRYTVKPGDSLSSIAAKVCGNYRDWLGLWHATGHMPDPNLIFPGRQVTVACNDRGPGYTPPAPAVTTTADTTTTRHDRFDGGHGACGDGDGDGLDAPCSAIFGAPAAPAAAQAPAQPAAVSSSYSGSGGMQSCIISRESGGNSQVWNASGHYGLYQFSSSTWAAHGGNPADFGHASVAEQNAVYAATVAADGYSDWAPYDGC